MRPMTPTERAAVDRIIAAARRFVRAADEFGDDYPEACGEYMQALDEAQAEYGRVCDALPVEPVNIPRDPDPTDPGVPGERVTRLG